MRTKPRKKDEDRLKIRNFRMNDKDWAALVAYFKERRLQVGSGIRMIIADYLRKQGVLK
jgi:hypothetical protein